VAAAVNFMVNLRRRNVFLVSTVATTYVVWKIQIRVFYSHFNLYRSMWRKAENSFKVETSVQNSMFKEL